MKNAPEDRIAMPRRLVMSGVALMTAGLLAAGAVAPSAVAAPNLSQPAAFSLTQNVGWMNAETASYLTSIGMDVMVPSWLPSPFEGTAPDVYAGDGSYSLYWIIPGGTPTFLHITGVIGAPFPDGSKADLNKPLSVNTSVQGWPAIQDIGIPAGSDTPIYDQVWWIANGVRYSVESNNIGTDSLTLANSMVYLEAPASEPVYEEPVYEEPVVVEEPYVPPTEIPYEPPMSEPVYEEPVVVEEPVADETVSEAPAQTETQSQGEGGETDASSEPVTSEGPVGGSTTSPSGDTSGEGPWSPDKTDPNVPSDGTAGPRPPVIGGDGTGGWYDTSLPDMFTRP